MRAGYKQTEVGVIPEDWDVVSLGEYVEITSGDSPSKVKMTSSGIPYFKVEQLNNAPKYTGETPYFFQKGKTVSGGSIIFPKRGASILLNKIRILQEDSFMDTNLMSLTSSEGLFNEYLFYCLNFQGLASVADTTSIPQINNKHILPFKISYPVAEEQKAISKALSDVDELIVSLEKLIAKKRDIKTGTMQQLLTGKKRLAGFGEDKGYKQSELGEIPEDWDIKTYGDIFAFYTTASNSRDDLSENGSISYIHYGDIHTKWDITLDMNASTLPKIARHKFKGAAFIKDGDVVMADASEDYEGIGKSIEISGVGNAKAIAGLHTFLMRDNDETYVDGFRGYLHLLPAVKTSFDRLATGLKVYGLSKNSLKTVFIPVPPKKEQEKIVEILAGMTVEIDSLLCQLSKTKAIKQGMMQELLTGRTRLI